VSGLCQERYLASAPITPEDNQVRMEPVRPLNWCIWLIC